MLSKEEGKELIGIAKESISYYFSGKDYVVSDELKEMFNEKFGVFVTLKIKDELRGCIGFVEGMMPLYESVVDSAKAAAFSDPRFRPLTKEEFEKINIEVSVLTKPELIEVNKAEEYLDKIIVGENGLIVKGSGCSGLLLPQVALEWKWDVKQFLENLCQKAGLDKDAWKELDNKIYKFQAQVFEEE